jgi:hypothetical protein
VLPVSPPASPTRLASANLVSTTLKLMPWFTTEQYLVTTLSVSMTTSMLWKFLIAATSSRAVAIPPVGLNAEPLLFITGSIVLALTRHIDAYLNHVIVELIEQSVGGANAILALDMVATLPALVLSQNSRSSIVSTFALDLHPMLIFGFPAHHICYIVRTGNT